MNLYYLNLAIFSLIEWTFSVITQLIETHAVGYGAWDTLHAALRCSPVLRFDYFLKSRSQQELNRRVDMLV